MIKPNTPESMKEAFEKGLKFMSRLDNNNIVFMHGWNLLWQHPIYYHEVHGERPEFPTSSYLKKFKVVTLTESEIQGEDHITAGIDLGSYGYADC